MNEAPALSLSGIAKRFGAVEALSDARLELRRGSVHALLGENGAGKTTLMRIAYGLLRADRGEMRVDGAVLAEERVHGAAPQLESCVTQGLDRAEGLRDAAQRQRRRLVHNPVGASMKVDGMPKRAVRCSPSARTPSVSVA